MRKRGSRLNPRLYHIKRFYPSGAGKAQTTSMIPLKCIMWPLAEVVIVGFVGTF